MDSYRGRKIEFHIIQSFPVSCLNRDDVGSPKSAWIGGTLRARVSSQAWKRQVRMRLHEMGIKIALRTKHVADRILEFMPPCVDSDKAQKAAQAVSKVLAKDTLYFFSETEARALAQFIVDKQFPEKLSKEQKKEVFRVQKNAATKGFKDLDGLDIALFGRMVANAASLDIEAASSFAHAISTHKVSPELDFFSALDDRDDSENDDAGAAHISTNEFNSATYYRYVSLDLGQLVETLGGDENLDTAIRAFIQALFIAVPFARQATMSGASPWDFARVYIRKGQRLQVSFDKPVRSKGEGYAKPSIEYLRNELDSKEKMFGSLFGKVAEYEWGLDEDYSVDDLIDDVLKAARKEQ